MNAKLHTIMSDRSLYGFEIANALDGMVDVLSADQIGNLRGPVLAVCNTSPLNTRGSHWVGICIDNQQRGEFFDSYGLHPMAYGMECGMEHAGSWTYNDILLQSFNSSVCGHYVIGYCFTKMAGLRMEEFVYLFCNDTKINDEKIYNLIKNTL